MNPSQRAPLALARSRRRHRDGQAKLSSVGTGKQPGLSQHRHAGVLPANHPAMANLMADSAAAKATRRKPAADSEPS